jgi:DNA-binding transcriptional MerR regulator
MKKFSIKDLENLSGIKAHTLRVWEHRYNFIKPQRTSANFRYYTVDELKRLLHLNLLNKNGHKISQLAALHPEQIEEKIEMLGNDDDRKQRCLNDLLIAMYTLNTESFEQTLDLCFSSWPINEAMEDIIFVFLKKIGLLWSGGRLTEEHFAVTAIRKKIMAGIDAVQPTQRKDRSVLLFLPEGRQLDLGLLYAHYVLKQSGLQVLYMGSDVSVSNLKTVFAHKKPQFIFTYLPEKTRFRVDELLPYLHEHLDGSTIVVATYSSHYKIPHEQAQLVTLEYEQALHYIAD